MDSSDPYKRAQTALDELKSRESTMKDEISGIRGSQRRIETALEHNNNFQKDLYHTYEKILVLLESLRQDFQSQLAKSAEDVQNEIEKLKTRIDFIACNLTQTQTQSPSSVSLRGETTEALPSHQYDNEELPDNSETANPITSEPAYPVHTEDMDESVATELPTPHTPVMQAKPLDASLSPTLRGDTSVPPTSARTSKWKERSSIFVTPNQHPFEMEGIVVPQLQIPAPIQNGNIHAHTSPTRTDGDTLMSEGTVIDHEVHNEESDTAPERMTAEVGDRTLTKSAEEVSYEAGSDALQLQSPNKRTFPSHEESTEEAITGKPVEKIRTDLASPAKRQKRVPNIDIAKARAMTNKKSQLSSASSTAFNAEAGDQGAVKSSQKDLREYLQPISSEGTTSPRIVEAINENNSTGENITCKSKTGDAEVSLMALENQIHGNTDSSEKQTVETDPKEKVQPSEPTDEGIMEDSVNPEAKNNTDKERLNRARQAVRQVWNNADIFHEMLDQCLPTKSLTTMNRIRVVANRNTKLKDFIPYLNSAMLLRIEAGAEKDQQSYKRVTIGDFTAASSKKIPPVHALDDSNRWTKHGLVMWRGMLLNSTVLQRLKKKEATLEFWDATEHSVGGGSNPQKVNETPKLVKKLSKSSAKNAPKSPKDKQQNAGNNKPDLQPGVKSTVSGSTPKKKANDENVASSQVSALQDTESNRKTTESLLKKFGAKKTKDRVIE